MMEKIRPFPEKSPQEKLEALVNALESLKHESHKEIPEEIREAAIQANEQRIKEFLELHPELKNTWH